jgi:hypothetical protein
MDYDMYLFSCLLKNFDKTFDDQPYDWQYDVLPELYKEFEDSQFNIDTKSAYDCMVDFLNYKMIPKPITP